MSIPNRSLESRIYKYKNPAMEFICPLCNTPRAFRYHPRLSFQNYFQIVILSIMSIYFLYPVMQMRSYFMFFLFWAMMEGGKRFLFRREIPCPHCGFDASWYQRDIKMARQKVKDFWAKKIPKEN